MSHKDQVYQHLLEAIISNRIPPGTPVVETEVSTELNVSRTPVREALKELEAEGLVCRYPSIGTVVTEITPHDVEEIFSLRILLETFALQLTWDKITEEELDSVETSFAYLDLNSAGDAYREADIRLHSLIVERTGNKRLARFLGILNSQIERFRRIAAYSATRPENSKKEHLEIIHYLRTGDLQACEQSLRNHLTSVKNSTLEVAKIFRSK